MMVLQVVFFILSVITLGGAVGVVTSRNIFHSALFLILSFVGVAGFYVTLEAGFLAAVQVLIYVGAIAILILFAIMVSQRLMAAEQIQRNEQWLLAAIVAVAIFLVLGFTLWQVSWPVAHETPPPTAIARLGQELLGPYVVPFEVASILLVVAMIGAIILAREQV
jgi:NADH:ubiquinone oxidoreductase subunit 6 (subunit J)